MKNDQNSKWIQFLGGKSSLYTLILICLLAVTVFVLNTISFVFEPLWVIFFAILPPVIFSLVLYYLFNPIVNFGAKKGISRTLIVAAIYILVLVLFIIGGMQVISIIEQQARELWRQLPTLFDEFLDGARNLLSNTPFYDQFDQFVSSIDDITGEITNFLMNYWQDGAQRISNLFSAVSTAAITVVIGPVIAFFLLKNPKKFYRSLVNLVPPAFRKDFNELAKIANQQIGAFLKGQVIASLLMGIIYWGLFVLIGLEFATIIAFAAGILCIIPYIGPFIAFFPGLFIAFQDSGFMVVKFVIVWFVVQLVHGDFIIPRVMGDRLKIHPITILVVLLVMGDLFGLFGVIFGIPMYTLIKLLVIFLFRKFKQRYNRYYGNKGKYEKTDFSKDDYFE